jgi:hypothetical protein
VKWRSRSCSERHTGGGRTANLPELKYKELVNLFKAFCHDLEGVGSSKLKGTNRLGHKVGAHCHPSHVFWPEALTRLLGDMEVSRDEFEKWVRKGRKPKAPD